MYRPRIIPVLLLKGKGLYKSTQFKNHHYIGDPINAVKIFNDLKADELVFLDIDASKEKRLIDLNFVREVGEEANMPFAVGGGIKNLKDIENLIQAGAEKVIIQSAAIQDPNFIPSACAHFGSSSIAVCIDVKKNWLGKNQVMYLNASKSASYGVLEFAKLMEKNGVGEIILQSVDLDGTRKGYANDLIKEIAQKLSIPLIALGGANHINDLVTIYKNAHVSGVAAGSFFIYQGNKKGVLISYPEKFEINLLFNQLKF